MGARGDAASRDLTLFLWLLKLGALLNGWFIVRALALGDAGADPRVVVPALVLFVVSAYRCLLPNRYKDNVVLHASPLSSTFVTRVLATFSEVAFIYLLSHVLRMLNVDRLLWVDALSWAMVAIVCVSQVCVWGAIVTGRLNLYSFEEVGWALIIVANTAASVWLFFMGGEFGDRTPLLVMNLLFGLVYLPWQLIHVRSLLVDARGDEAGPAERRTSLAIGLRRSLFELNRRTDSASWGGLIGLTWMTAYWAALIPVWVYQIVVITHSH